MRKIELFVKLIGDHNIGKQIVDLAETTDLYESVKDSIMIKNNLQINSNILLDKLSKGDMTDDETSMYLNRLLRSNKDTEEIKKIIKEEHDDLVRRVKIINEYEKNDEYTTDFKLCACICMDEDFCVCGCYCDFHDNMNEPAFDGCYECYERDEVCECILGVDDVINERIEIIFGEENQINNNP